MSQTNWFYCLRHRTAEAETECRATDRLGPYPDRESAEAALETVAQRNESWDNDPDWNDPDSEPDDEQSGDESVDPAASGR